MCVSVTERERETERDRETERERETERDRDRERRREKESRKHGIMFIYVCVCRLFVLDCQKF